MKKWKNMTKEERNWFWSQVMIYGCLGYILVYYILKMVGIINTPSWLQQSTIVIGILAAIKFIYDISGFVQKMNPLPKRVNKIAIGLTRLENKFNLMENDISIVKKAISKHETCKNFKPAY